MAQSKNKSIYWDINKSLSYNALFNFIVGNRGGGKTYGSKKYCIDRFLKRGEQFIYLRRYKTELRQVKTFFDDIADKYEGHEFKVLGRELYIDDKLCGYAMALSVGKTAKSVAFPKVGTIVFDEFILDKGTTHYLTDEITHFLEFYETVARMRDVKVYFLSNALTVTNPYFLYFDLKTPYGRSISCHDDILIEMVANEEFIKEKNETRFANIIKGTPYADYAINNKFLRDNKSFIEKKSGKCKCMFIFDYNDETYGVWINYNAGKIWVSYDHDPGGLDESGYGLKHYALTKADHKPNTLLITSLKSDTIFKMFISQYKIGNVFYESMNIKNIVNDIVRMAAIY